jgi:hypothetical protein
MGEVRVSGDRCQKTGIRWDANKVHEGGRKALKMRRSFNKMTTFDDFRRLPTTFGRLLTIDVAGGDEVPESVLFDIKGLWIVAATKCGVIERRVKSTGYGWF